MRITVWVRPRSGRSAVGGERDGALVVRVTEPPEGGRATEASLVVLARALGVRRGAVTLVSGGSSRTKVVDVEGDATRLGAVLERLRAAAPTERTHAP